MDIHDWIRIHYENEIEKLMLTLQKQAQRELEKLRRHVINVDIVITAGKDCAHTEEKNTGDLR